MFASSANGSLYPWRCLITIRCPRCTFSETELIFSESTSRFAAFARVRGTSCSARPVPFVPTSIFDVLFDFIGPRDRMNRGWEVEWSKTFKDVCTAYGEPVLTL